MANIYGTADPMQVSVNISSMPYAMALALSLPAVDANPANPPEIRIARVGPWLDETARREPIEAARLVGDALAATNRVAMSDSKRLDLAERYWTTAIALWPQLERQFTRATHPLSGEPLKPPRRL